VYRGLRDSNSIAIPSTRALQAYSSMSDVGSWIPSSPLASNGVCLSCHVKNWLEPLTHGLATSPLASKGVCSSCHVRNWLEPLTHGLPTSLLASNGVCSSSCHVGNWLEPLTHGLPTSPLASNGVCSSCHVKNWIEPLTHGLPSSPLASNGRCSIKQSCAKCNLMFARTLSIGFMQAMRMLSSPTSSNVISQCKIVLP
jgi:hypothetical protein